MVFEVLKDADGELCFATAAKTRRGRGVLYGLAPWVICLLALSAVFALALADLIPPGWTHGAAVVGAGAAAALTPIAYALGHRARDRVEADARSIRIAQSPSWGAPRHTSISVAELTGLAIDPSIRSLGADLLLVALHRDGRRIPIAEGDPHAGQLRELGRRAAEVTGLRLQSAAAARSQAEQ